jgi:hypothetical protein
MSPIGNRDEQAAPIYRDDGPGHADVATRDEGRRLDDEADALIAEMEALDREEREDRKQEARDDAFFKRFDLVGTAVCCGLYFLAWLAAHC